MIYPMGSVPASGIRLGAIQTTDLPPAHTSGDFVFFTFIALLIAGNVLWMNREYFRRGGLGQLGRDVAGTCRKIVTSIRKGWRDVAVLYTEFPRLYREGRAEMRAAAPPPRELNLVGLTQAILLNSITILGVFKFHWTVGSALALYWAENLLTGFVILAGLLIWRRVNKDRAGDLRVTPFEVSLMTVFNGAHLVFLLIFLGFMLPQIAPTEGFDRNSFVRGLILIATLLLLNFVRLAWRARAISPARLQETFTSFMQRVAVLHLTIIIGMFALLLFGQARAFFAVFAGLKLIVDLAARSSHPAEGT